MSTFDEADPLNCSWRTHLKDGEWIPDFSTSKCMICKTSFTWWIRRHHCRRCGAVVCDSCSNHRTKFTTKNVGDASSEEEVRVCDPCIDAVDKQVMNGLTKRFRKDTGSSTKSNVSSSIESIFGESSKDGRAVITVGKYRAEIKESEGNRYIRDVDL